jgi:hypothetical protein
MSDRFESVFRHGAVVYIAGIKFQHWHWGTSKREIQKEAEDARKAGYRARVIKAHGGWFVALRRK